MLLIGSRAIRVHCPEFREARDWDLIGTDAEIARLDSLLERDGAAAPYKTCFRYQGARMEVVSSCHSSYWRCIQEKFANEPTMDLADIGEVAVAPLGYLLLTKQCGLVYRIVHWHKNLEDLCFLKDRVPTIAADIAELVPLCVEDSRRTFEKTHAAADERSGACHPSIAPPRNVELHRTLHERLALSGAALARQTAAWRGFPALSGEPKRTEMIRLFSEEAIVVAATEMLLPRNAAHREGHTEAAFVRWALRQLIVTDLPMSWRYFGVNHYREICSLIPEGWSQPVLDLRDSVTPSVQACVTSAPDCEQPGRR